MPGDIQQLSAQRGLPQKMTNRLFFPENPAEAGTMISVPFIRVQPLSYEKTTYFIVSDHNARFLDFSLERNHAFFSEGRTAPSFFVATGDLDIQTMCIFPQNDN